MRTIASIACCALALPAQTIGNAPANGYSSFPAVSADGRWVAFESTATNLDPRTGTISFQFHVYVRSMLTALTTRVGQGCGGSAGPAELTALTPPSLSGPTFVVSVDLAPPGAHAVLLIGAAAGVTRAPNGCELYVADPIAWLTSTISTNGHWPFGLPLPNQQSLIGQSLVLQVAFAHSGLPGGLGTTAGLHALVGR